MKKARLIKYVLLISSIAILVLSVSGVLVFHYYPKEKILTLITSGAEKTFKRKVVIKEIDYGLKGITLKNISIYNNLYDDNIVPESDIFASVKDVNIQFSLFPLLKKEFVVKRLVCNNLKINISYDKGKSNLGNFLNDLKSSGDSEGDSGIEAKISSIKFKNAEITLKQPPELLKPLEGRYVFNGTVNLSSASLVSVSDCQIILPEERGAVSSDRIDIAILENNFELTADCLLQRCSLLWVYKWGDDLSLPFGTFTGNVRKLKISKDFIEGYAKGNCVLTNKETVAADGKCKVDINREIVYLLDIKANIQKSKFTINEIQISAKTGIQDRLLKFNISDIDVNLNDLKVASFMPADIFGEVSGNISSEKKLYNGTLNLRNVSLRSGQKDIIKINSEISINNSNIYKEKIPVFIYDQPCQISVSTSGKNLQKIILNLYAKDFNYQIGNEETSKKAFTPVKIKSEITGRVELDNLNINKYIFSNVAVSYSFTDGKLYLNQVNGNFMGGAVKGKGYIDLSSEKPYVNVSAGFNEIKVQNFAVLYNELSGRFFGIAKGNADIEFDIDKDSGIFNSLKGKIEFNIDKGKLVNTGVQKGLGIWLSELRYKLNNLEFTKIYGNLNIIGNNCYVNSMLFNASDIRLKMDGYFSRPLLDSKKIPGELKIDLEFNDYFIQDIPNLPQAQFISKLLTIPALKKKGDWYIMSFKDKGEDITDGNNIKPL